MAISVALSIKSSSQPDRIKGIVALSPPTVAQSAIPPNLASSFKGAENADAAIIDAVSAELCIGK